VVFASTSALQSIARHLNDVPPPPSRQAKYPVPEDLDRLVLRLLAKRPDDRPASAAELAGALADLELEPWTEQAAEEWWNNATSARVPATV
jgi:hypothetical protein